MKEDVIFRACDRDSVETVILIKYVNEFEEKRKLMVEFLKKFEGRGIKIARVN